MIKFLRGSALLLAAIMVVTACGGGGASSAPTATTPPASQPAASGGSSPAAGGSITVTSLWGGAEQTNFEKVLTAFTAKTGIAVKYESVRDNYATALQTRISGGNPPDVAIIPGIGFLRRFSRDGSIIKVSDLGIDPASLEPNYAPGLLDIGKVDGDLYGIIVKLNSKSTVWYRPDQFTGFGVTAPTDWDGFTKLLKDIAAKGKKPLGLGAKDSWTLTDWFESIYVRQAGPEAYDKLFSKDGDWTDPSVATAVKAMTDVLNDTYVDGGIKAALGRGFVDGIGQVFSANPTASVYYEGGFVGGIATGQVNTALKPGTDIDWFPFPKIGSGDGVTIGGDVIAALTKNPGVKEFIQYMTTPEAGGVWAATGAIISPVKGVDASVYPNDLAKREAAQVAGASAVRMDGSDLLPAGGPDLGAELQKAIQGQTVDWASYQTQIQTAWTNE
ncbi:MAG: alpha-glucoside transport system substrate-binding protein [Chloroflexota bacterium]|jgi:ABC-type glycerol-3-phosphate transport system substrate-binding protein|nr:alpha-glucoside transport system substrate-binding protein [Chloroflexota bacterium]